MRFFESISNQRSLGTFRFRSTQNRSFNRDIRKDVFFIILLVLPMIISFNLVLFDERFSLNSDTVSLIHLKTLIIVRFLIVSIYVSISNTGILVNNQIII